MNLHPAELDWDYSPSDKGPFRPVPRDPASDICLNMARSWLKRCSGHPRCQKIAEVPLPSRLIRVPSNKNNNPRLYLTEPGERGRYLTLSHCWGSGINFVLRTSNLAELQQSISFDQLPKSFQDAIIITRRLGFRYIWIDALCIVQDCEKDWAQQSSLMAKVYRNGALMLSALGASDSQQGLLRPRKVPRSHCFGKKQEFIWQAKSEWTSQFIQSPKPLNKRAWAYQERVMAPRILHFAEKKLLWECADGQWTEDLGLTRVAYPHNEKPRIERFLRHFGAPETEQRVPNKGVKLRKRLLAYYECVNNYTKRSLTKDTDKLPAFSGLASAFHVPELGDYLAGLWQHDLVYGLDWRIVNDTENSPSGPDSTAPSWSWASVPAVCEFNNIRQLIYHAYTRDKWTAEYGHWLETQAPSLVSHSYHLQTADVHGRVSDASITLRGYFRSIMVRTGAPMNWSGTPVELDRGSRNGYPWKFASPHEWEPSPRIDWCRVQEVQVKDFIALQIGMTSCSRMSQQLELVMLILEPVDGRDETYRRVGRLEVKMSYDETLPDKWQHGELVLI